MTVRISAMIRLFTVDRGGVHFSPDAHDKIGIRSYLHDMHKGFKQIDSELYSQYQCCKSAPYLFGSPGSGSRSLGHKKSL